MPVETIEWILLAVSPFLAVGFACMMYNAIFARRAGELLQEMDQRMDSAYRTWREWTKARGGVQPAFSSTAFEKTGETCFAYEREAVSYEPVRPHTSVATDGLVFDTPCGMSVSGGWSILDCFDGVQLVGRGALFVTDQNLYLRGTGTEIKIPLKDVWMVATACSSFLIEARSMDRPLIFTGVNGQKLRDTIHMLMEAV